MYIDLPILGLQCILVIRTKNSALLATWLGNMSLTPRLFTAAFATLVGLADPLTHSPPMRLKAHIGHKASHSVTDISL